jgi:hypothetical protein
MYYAASQCGNPATACLMPPQCAPAGHYTARFCA